jgi:hypothetical protein
MPLQSCFSVTIWSGRSRGFETKVLKKEMELFCFFLRPTLISVSEGETNSPPPLARHVADSL